MPKKDKGKIEGAKPKAATRAGTRAKAVTPPEEKTPGVDLAEVRKDISNIVGSRAAELTNAVIEEGKKGQLAPVKYLFEVSGLFPASETNEMKPDEECLAQTLMRKLNLPESPIESEDGEESGSGNINSSSLDSSGSGEGTMKPAVQSADAGSQRGAPERTDGVGV